VTLMDDDDDAIVLREVQYGSFCDPQLRAEVRLARLAKGATPDERLA
jgi:hypothetical protein